MSLSESLIGKGNIPKKLLTRRGAMLSVLLIALALQACTQAEPEQVVVTQVVEVEREVTRIVEGTPVVETVVEEVEVTRVVEVVATEVPMGEMVPELVVSQLAFPSYEEWWRQLPVEFAKAGIMLDVQPIEANAWIAQCIGEHECGTFTSTGSGVSDDRIDPNWFLNEILHSKRAGPGGNNLSSWQNAEVDALIDAQAVELDPEVRRDLIFQIQEIFARETPFIPVYFINDVQAYNKEKFDDVLIRPSAGILRPNNLTSFLNVTPLTDQSVLRVENNHDGNSTNPFVASGGVFNTATMTWVYDTLARMDENLEIIPWAAESWEWLDNTTLVVNIRPGMTFHDGTPVTAEDVAFTFEYVQTFEFARWLPILDIVESVDQVDDMTVQFNLKAPFAPFEANVLTAFFIVPKALWENVDDPETYENPDPIGSGPFKFGHWRKNESWLFERNPDHFRAPQVDVLWAIIPSPETWLGQFETQELDANGTYIRGDAQIDLVESYEHMEVVTVPGIGVQSIYIDTRVLPGCDLAFRQAVHHLTPKAQLLDVVAGKGGGFVAEANWLRPESSWYQSGLPNYEYDLDKAIEVLTEAGYSWDDVDRLHYPVGLSCE